MALLTEIFKREINSWFKNVFSRNEKNILIKNSYQELSYLLGGQDKNCLFKWLFA